jgi:glucosamine--fructose-6-phosphate aminotransferase (isomerizing)
MFVGSDAIALAPMTNRITYLDEGDFAVLTRNSVQIWDAQGALANREVRTIRGEAGRYDKDGYQHFMAKEIHEQPSVVSKAIKHYLGADGHSVTLPGEGLDFTQFDRITMVACGTAYLACFTAKILV